MISVEIKDSCPLTKEAMLEKIREVGFACIDLNLFLDTHPDNQEALDLFKKCAFTLKSLKNEYQLKYGPLYVCDTDGTAPFKWVAKNQPWPWEKEV